VGSETWGKLLRWLLAVNLLCFGVGIYFRSSTLFLLCFVGDGYWIAVGLFLEWFETHARILRKWKTPKHLMTLVFDSIPYLAGLFLIGAFIFYSSKRLIGKNVYPASGLVGKIVAYSFAALFMLGPLVVILSFLRNRTKPSNCKCPEFRTTRE
jgi:hypothetical protein